MDHDDSPFAPAPVSADTTAFLRTEHRLNIPDHELLRCIGRGSYGSVWLARNRTGMYRAVKIVLRNSFDNERPFQREWSGIRMFEPISRSHEGFIDVLHVGINQEEGYFYYVMELGDDQVSGQKIDTERYTPQTLAKQISQHGRIPLAECLQLGLALSAALAELHKNGLVHRDVKPSNIIFVNGVPKLADIGLVADVNEARSYVGTEGFIPPEGPGSPQADVYGLGKVLYEASTGKDRQEFPDLPTTVDRLPDHEVFLELNEVILQACKNDIKSRYQSAGDLHAELLVVTNGKSIKRLRALERLLSNLKRVAVVAGTAVLLGSVVAYHVYQERRRGAEKLQQLVGESIGYGTRAIESQDFISGLKYFGEALWLERGVKERQLLHRLRFDSTLEQCPKLLQVWWRKGHMENVDISSDGRYLLMARMSPPQAEVIDLESGRQLGQFTHKWAIRSASFHPEGQLVVTASLDSTAVIWNANDGTQVVKLQHPNGLFSARFSRDGSRVVTAGANGLVWVWDWRNQQVIHRLAFHTNDLQFAGFSPDGTRIVSGGKDCYAQLWNAASGDKIGPPMPHASWVRHAAFSPDGQTLVTSAQDDKAHVWDVSTERPRPVPPDLTHNDRMGTVEFGPDGRLLVTASLDGTARVWLINTHQLLKPVGILRHSDRVSSAMFAPDGHRVVTSCVDGTVRLWDLADEILPAESPDLFCLDGSKFVTTTNGWVVYDTLSGRSVGSAIRPPDGFKPAGLSGTGDVVLGIRPQTSQPLRIVHAQVWDVLSRKPLGSEVVSFGLDPELSNDGKLLVTFNKTEATQLDLRSGVTNSVRHPEPISGAVFSRDSSQVAVWSRRQLTLWKIGKATVFPPLKLDADVSFVDFSPDGSKLVTCHSQNLYEHCPAIVWDTQTGKEKFRVEHGDGVVFASFNSEGSRLVTGGEDSKAIIWDGNTGAYITSVRHGNHVRSVYFSRDSKWILTASLDKTARIWSAETSQPLTPPLRHVNALFDAQFLPGELRVVSVDRYRILHVWDLPASHASVSDQMLFANLLCGERILGVGVADSTKPEAVKAVWDDLRARYPAFFTVSPRGIEVWHDFQARECDLEQQFAAEEFHLKRLLQYRPADADVSQRLAHARARLATQKDQ